MMRRFLLACSVGSVIPAIASSQTLKIFPSRVLVGETPTIRAEGLEPNARVSMRAELVDGANEPWFAQADFLADPNGVVDTSIQAPVSGSYNETSAMGLVWSMKPDAKHVPWYQPPRDLAPQTIEFHLIRKGQQAASGRIEQLAVADGVQRIAVDGAIHGVLLVPKAAGRHPGVLVVGGSEGGIPLRKAAWLASHGYAALALAYFRYDDLPPRLEGIALEYFGSALAWMMRARKSRVKNSRLWVLREAASLRSSWGPCFVK
jgi:Acyl-CoA thioester hydrolase/BAAT N-terminal region